MNTPNERNSNRGANRPDDKTNKSGHNKAPHKFINPSECPPNPTSTRNNQERNPMPGPQDCINQDSKEKRP